MKRPFFILSLLYLSLHINAQIPSFDIPSPNAAELGSYGDVPVSYYTGKADINIPLYSLTIRDVSLPITLNYNASGILINKLPGWLGDNWSLSAGGLITRVVQGDYDELVYPEEVQARFASGRRYNYFQSYQTLNRLINNPNNNYQELRDTVLCQRNDLAPDLFYFNFLGKTGRFFLGNDGQWKVDSEANLEVIFDITDENNYIDPFIINYPSPYDNYHQPKTIKGFVIRDELGIQYHFGEESSCIEYSVPFFRQGDREFVIPWTANSWYLKSIIDRNGNTLYSFEYERGKYVAQLYNNGIQNSWVCHKNNNGNYYTINGNGPNNYTGNNSGWDFPFDGVLNSPIYLKTITARDGTVLRFYSSDLDISMTQLYASMYAYYSSISQWYANLHNPNTIAYHITLPCYYLQTNDSEARQYQYNPSSDEKLTNPLVSCRLRKLDRITIEANNTATAPIYNFVYSNYPRMHLTTVEMKDVNNATEGLYQLRYSNYEDLPSDYISKKEDHWGYFNNSNYTLPTTTQGYINFYNMREPSRSYTWRGMLEKIIYPTGGMTVFSFEPHEYARYISEDRSTIIDETDHMDHFTGGVRILSIAEYEDSTMSKLISLRGFRYVDPETGISSGELFSKPKYYWENWNAVNIDPLSYSSANMFRTSSIIPLSNMFGPHVGYSYVTESYRFDLKETTYHYSNLSDALDYPSQLNFTMNSLTPYNVYTDRCYRRGQLISVMETNGFKTFKETEFFYRTDDVESNYVLTSSLFADFYVLNPWQRPLTVPDYTHFDGGVYKLFYPKYDVVKETTKTYYESGVITDSVIYAKKDTTLNVTFGSYSHSVDVRTTKSKSTKRKADVATHTFTYPFESVGIEAQLAGLQFYLLPVAVEEKLNNVVTKKYQTAYQNYNGMILPKYELEWKSGVVADTIVTYNGYTGTGAVSSFRKRGQPVTSLIWTNNDCLLSNKTVGGSLSTFYRYMTNNKIGSIVMPNGDVKFYDYDAMGRLKEIYDQNGNTIQKFSYNYSNK